MPANISGPSFGPNDNQNVLSTLRRGSVEAFIINLVGFGMVFLMHAVLGRLIGPEQYGIFSYALSMATLLSIVVPLGWPTALLRFVAQYTAQQKPGLVWGSILRGHQVTLMCCCLVSLVLWALGRFGALPGKLADSFVYAAFLLPPLTFFVLHHRIFRGLQKIGASMIPKSLVVPLSVTLGALAVSAATARSAVGIYAAAGFASAFLSAWWLWHSLKRGGFIVRPEFQTRVWMGIALPMVLVGLSREIINRTDMVMLGAMADMDAVGLYGAAVRVATMNTFVLTAINAIAAPLFSAAYHGGRPAEYRMILKKSVLWSTTATVPLLAVMLLWPEVILRCFGPAFVAGSPLLRILALGQFVNSATGPVGIALLMSDKQGIVALSNGVAALLNIMVNFWLIAKMGALGAAIATSACIALLNLWELYLCKKRVLDVQGEGMN
jgi:O-antigen/teichoic acid export membrane protein